MTHDIDAVIERSPSDDLIAFAITETFGPRCETTDSDCYTCQAWERYDRSLKGTIPASSPAPESAEPVAWRYRWKLDGEWVNWRVSDVSQKHPSLKDFEEQPLYAAPAPQAGETEAEKKLRQCQWYWPEHDTESEYCRGSAQEVVEEAYGWNGKDGDVIAVARGGIVEVTYCASLPPADDSDNDDEFWVEEATKEAAQAKIDAEQARRAALRANGGQPNV